MQTAPPVKELHCTFLKVYSITLLQVEIVVQGHSWQWLQKIQKCSKEKIFMKFFVFPRPCGKGPLAKRVTHTKSSGMVWRNSKVGILGTGGGDPEWQPGKDEPNRIYRSLSRHLSVTQLMFPRPFRNQPHFEGSIPKNPKTISFFG